MRYPASRILFAAALQFVLIGLCFGQTNLRVNEAATRIDIRADGIGVNLPIENPLHEKIPVHVLLELMDPKGTVQAHAEEVTLLSAGSTKLKLALPVLPPQKDKKDQGNWFWYRLRYTITPNSANESLSQPFKGILSVGAVTPDLFELHVAGPDWVMEGQHYTYRVRAIHPVTAHPVAGVMVQAFVDAADDKEKAKRVPQKTAVTDRQGFAKFDLTMPQEIDDDEINIEMAGKLGSFAEEADENIHVNHSTDMFLNTDKTLYQPGADGSHTGVGIRRK